MADEDLSDEGLWYYTATGIEQIHQTTTGEGITVAVIDSPINPAAPELQGADVTVTEPSYCYGEDGQPAPATATDESGLHGTSMTSLIVGSGVGANGQRGVQGLAPGAAVHFYSKGFEDDTCFPPPLSRNSALRQAVDDGADIVSMSFGSTTVVSDMSEEDVAYALAHGVILVASLPNDDPGFPTYPNAFNGVVGVAAGTPEGGLRLPELTDDTVDVIAPGVQLRVLTPSDDWTVYVKRDGTSGATAYTAGALALVWSAYPDATANQILQSLIRNTGADDHDPVWAEGWGYGMVNVRHMLANDPTQYPDVNPLLTQDANALPTSAQVDAQIAALTAATSTPAPSPSPTASATAIASEEGADSGLSAGVLAAGAGALVVIGVVTVTALVLAGRRRSATRTSPDQPIPGA
ncbi:S8 family peptidase [Cellulomonas soli]